MTGFWMSRPLCDLWNRLKWMKAWLNRLKSALSCCTQAAHTESLTGLSRKMTAYRPVTCVNKLLLHNNLHIYHSASNIFPYIFLYIPLWEAVKRRKNANLTSNNVRLQALTPGNLKAHEISCVCFQHNGRYSHSPAGLLLSHFWEVELGNQHGQQQSQERRE